jgi:hypothetical protein
MTIQKVSDPDLVFLQIARRNASWKLLSDGSKSVSAICGNSIPWTTAYLGDEDLFGVCTSAILCGNFGNTTAICSGFSLLPVGSQWIQKVLSCVRPGVGSAEEDEVTCQIRYALRLKNCTQVEFSEELLQIVINFLSTDPIREENPTELWLTSEIENTKCRGKSTERHQIGLVAKPTSPLSLDSQYLVKSHLKKNHQSGSQAPKAKKKSKSQATKTKKNPQNGRVRSCDQGSKTRLGNDKFAEQRLIGLFVKPTCLVCSLSFESESLLNSHLRVSHHYSEFQSQKAMSEIPSSWRCAQCPHKTFQYSFLYENHLIVQHNHSSASASVAALQYYNEWKWNPHGSTQDTQRVRVPVRVAPALRAPSPPRMDAW